MCRHKFLLYYGIIMNAFKLIILLVTLPILFILPFILTSEKPLKEVVTEDMTSVPGNVMGTKDFLQKKNLKKVGPDIPKKSVKLGKEYTQRIFKNTNAHKSGAISSVQYMLAVPPEPWPESVKFPLIIHFSDTKGAASYSGHYFSKDKIAYDFPAINVVPILDDSMSWASYNKAEPKQFVDILMDFVAAIQVETSMVDLSRIYLVGCGHGAEGVFAAIERYPSVFAATMAHSGGWDITKSKYLTNTPIYSVTGKDNVTYPTLVMREIAKKIKQGGGNIVYKEIPSLEHECRAKGYFSPKALSWMFSYKR